MTVKEPPMHNIIISPKHTVRLRSFDSVEEDVLQIEDQSFCKNFTPTVGDDSEVSQK